MRERETVARRDTGGKRERNMEEMNNALTKKNKQISDYQCKYLVTVIYKFCSFSKCWLHLFTMSTPCKKKTKLKTKHQYSAKTKPKVDQCSPRLANAALDRLVWPEVGQCGPRPVSVALGWQCSPRSCYSIHLAPSMSPNTDIVYGDHIKKLETKIHS